MFLSMKSIIMLLILPILSTCVHWICLLNQLTECYDIGTSYIWRSSKRHKWEFTKELQKKADMWMCETLAKQASPFLGINNDDYLPWNDMHCVWWCVSEVQGEGNVVYSDVCVRYSVREMCTVMCVWGTGWGECVQ
jgi:hypothetical protein